jgi:hypothetical protein
MDDPLAQEREPGAAEHLPFDELMLTLPSMAAEL